MFNHGLKSLDSVPPTQHAKHVQLTAAFVWENSLFKSPDISSEYGDGKGILEQKHGYHIRHMWLLSAMHVPFYFTMSDLSFAWATVSVIELDYWVTLQHIMQV